MFSNFVKNLDALLKVQSPLLHSWLICKATNRQLNQDFKYTFIDADCSDLIKPTTNTKRYTGKYQKLDYIAKIGNATWTLLHSIAENYPDTPSTGEVNDTKTFIELLAKLYPCEHCANEFRNYISQNKPALKSRRNFVEWACEFHNHINQKIGKNIYDCTLK